MWPLLCPFWYVDAFVLATGSLACPLDRKVVHLGHEGASGLPVDFLVTDQMSIEDAYIIEQEMIEYFMKKNMSYEPKIYFHGITECMTQNPIDHDGQLKEWYDLIT